MFCALPIRHCHPTQTIPSVRNTQPVCWKLGIGREEVYGEEVTVFFVGRSHACGITFLSCRGRGRVWHLHIKLSASLANVSS